MEGEPTKECPRPRKATWDLAHGALSVPRSHHLRTQNSARRYRRCREWWIWFADIQCAPRIRSIPHSLHSKFTWEKAARRFSPRHYLCPECLRLTRADVCSSDGSFPLCRFLPLGSFGLRALHLPARFLVLGEALPGERLRLLSLIGSVSGIPSVPPTASWAP